MTEAEIMKEQDQSPIKVDTSGRNPVNPDFEIKVGSLIKAGPDGVDQNYDVIYAGRVHVDPEVEGDKGRHLFFGTPDSIQSGIPWGAEGQAKDLAIENLERSKRFDVGADSDMDGSLNNVPVSGVIDSGNQWYDKANRKMLDIMQTTAQKGEINTDIMLSSDFDKFGAAKTCRDMGPDWFLPSLEEMRVFHAILPVVAKATDIDVNDYYPKKQFPFWSSNETTNRKEAFRFDYDTAELTFTAYPQQKAGNGVSVQARVLCARY